MSYLFEVLTAADLPAYVTADADTRDEALADIREQLSLDDDDEVSIVAVHMVH